MRFLMSAMTLAAAALVSLVLAIAAAGAPPDPNLYTVHNLVSDQVGVADHVDANLVNAWGLASLATSPWWVADNGMDVSTLYAADGTAFPPPPAPMPLVVAVPNAPTGLVGNGGSGFVVGGASARFIFSTEEGKILAWNSSLGTQAQVVADRGVDAIYKGLAIARRPLVRDGLPQWPCRRLRRQLRSRAAPRSVRRSWHPSRVRAVRDSGDRRRHLRQLREAGRRCGGRCPGPGPRLRR